MKDTSYHLKLLGFLLLFVNSGCAVAGAIARTLDVKSMGAKGDGVSDDYEALVRAAVELCRSPEGSTLHFPPGEYRIDRYRIVRGPSRNRTGNIVYRGCKGVAITGDRAKIDVKGDFHRQAAVRVGRQAESYDVGVIPFEMIDSSDFVISGFEIDGNADLMSRDEMVAEGGNAGILTTNCQRYRLENLEIHHFPTDGITLGGNSTLADRDALLQNVTVRNNGRQGLSIIQLRTGKFIHCTFRDNGRTEGRYGRHEPSAGVDIEPVRIPPDEDIKTGDLRFEDCTFSENIGSQFITIWPAMVDSVVVSRSVIRATKEDTDQVAFLSAAAQSITVDCTFVFSGKRGISFGPLQPSRARDLQSVAFTGNMIRLQHGISLYSPVELAPVDFVSNTIHFSPLPEDNSPIVFRNMRLVANNRFIIHSFFAPGATAKVQFSRLQDYDENIVTWVNEIFEPPGR